MSRFEDRHPDDPPVLSMAQLSRMHKLLSTVVAIIFAILLGVGLGMIEMDKAAKRDRAATAKQLKAVSDSLTSAQQRIATTMADLATARATNDTLAMKLAATNRRVATVAMVLDTIEVRVEADHQDLAQVTDNVVQLSGLVGQQGRTIAQFQVIPDRVESLDLRVGTLDNRIDAIDTRTSSGMDQLRRDLRKRDWNKTGLWAIQLATLGAFLSHTTDHGGR